MVQLNRIVLKAKPAWARHLVRPLAPLDPPFPRYLARLRFFSVLFSAYRIMARHYGSKVRYLARR